MTDIESDHGSGRVESMPPDHDPIARLARATRPVAPPGFTDRVMRAVASEPPEAGRFEAIRRAFRFDGFRNPVPIAALGLAACAAIVLVLLSRSPEVPKDSLPAPDFVTHRFELAAPEARTVCLVGDFNNWKVCEAPLVKDEATGHWTVQVEIPRGRHEYMFVVDDRSWVTDPGAPVRVDDGFGNLNGVVFL